MEILKRATATSTDLGKKSRVSNNITQTARRNELEIAVKVEWV